MNLVLRSVALALTFGSVALAAPPSSKPASTGGKASSSAAKQECADAYEGTQEHLAESRLVRAKERALVCAQAGCPTFMQKECSRWVEELSARIPTVVTVAYVDGRENSEVRVFIDDQPIDGSDGKAIPLDPGRHQFRFVHPKLGTRNEQRVVPEGKHAFPIEARFLSPAVVAPVAEPAPVAAAPHVERRPDRRWAWGAAGSSAALLLGFAAVSGTTYAKEQSLRDGCGQSGGCATSDVDSLQTRYLVADVLLGLGVVGAGVATWLFISPPTREVEVGKTTLRLSIAPTFGGAFGAVGGRF